MKKLLFYLLFVFAATALQAQCGLPQSSIDLQGNNIRARILNGGDLFTDFNNAQFEPANNNPNGASTIFTAAFWMGGIDPAGNLKTAAVDYRSSGNGDYSAGPLSEDGITDAFTCANWDKIFIVNGSDINQFLQDLPLDAGQAIIQYRGIMGWPARGNPYFQQIWGFDLPFNTSPLAPFWDANGDAIYDPLDGDYPAVELRGIPLFVPAQIVWCVFNDQKGGSPHTTSNGDAIQAEIQLTAWAFNCPDLPILNNTIYTSHKIINRATEPIDSFYAGIWIDFDLGCYTDDYVGCRPDHSTIYAYNADVVDGAQGSNCNGVPTFPNPPVQSVTFLNENLEGTHIMDHFTAFGGTSPNGIPPVSYYNSLSGSWPDGTPLTSGGSGYGGSTPVDYLFPDDPAEPGGWSMCTANLPLSDMRVIGSQKFGTLFPGQVAELVTAWSVHQNPDLPCGIGNTLPDVDDLIFLHASGYESVCSPITTAPIYPSDSLDLFPNPTAATATLRYGSIPVEEIRVFDPSGKWLQTIEVSEKEQTEINLKNLPAGLYILRILTDQGTLTKELAIAR
ncbi:MAG: T9SS type A sorting domain-containing protein [Saprospiraceae bacterium]|nr:T9SS type A sorting domain-containing protein [Saprospiraceae bacterium]